MSQALTQQRLRIRFAKQGALRYVGHLDLATTWERVLRRAALPLEYTRGFNPRPRLQFAAALPVGLTSEAELLDVWLTECVPLELADALIERLNTTSPAGLRALQAAEVPIKAPALPPQVISAEYAITPNDPDLSADDLGARAQALLAQTHVERVLRGKVYDLRPLVQDLRLDGDGVLVARLSTGERANARADELIAALGLALHQVNAHRRRLFLSEE
ncbi:MAG: TIGR03936 family radical SAM-associated protein [Anaerolineae bacterium]|nr:TIGR03936 family radical SAM-associated protein [Anaerolineae bacterium]